MPRSRWFYRCAAVAGVASVIAVEAGWITAEVGRQPWIVYEHMRVAEAVTNISAGPIWTSFAILVVVYSLIAWAFVGLLLRMRLRWRRRTPGRGGRTRRAPGRRRPRAGEGRGAVSSADVVALVLLLAVAAYACGGGADYGAGFWDLTAGNDDRGARPRALVDYAMAPVWEANNVWLIFVFVVTWTGFPTVFEAVLSTAWVAIILAALGLVLRGAGFALRKPTRQAYRRRRYAAVFGLSSILTPFFFAAALGGVASGRDPGRQPRRRPGDLVAEPDVGAVRRARRPRVRLHRRGVPGLRRPPVRRARPGGLLPAALGAGRLLAARGRGRRAVRPALRRPLRLRRAVQRMGPGLRPGRGRRHRGNGGAGQPRDSTAAPGSRRSPRWRRWCSPGAWRSGRTCCRRR